MLLKIGETLILELTEDNGSVQRFRCKIAELRENEILIDYPIDETTGKTAIFLNGALMMANYVVDNHVFRFRTEFLHRVPGNVPLMLLKYEGEEGLERIQRRNFVRVDASLDIAVHSSDNLFRPFVTLTSDIGGGGVLVLLPEGTEISEGETVDMWICFASSSSRNQYLKIKGEIVRIFIDKLSHIKKASIEFFIDNEKERQPIIRFCFEKQLESRKKLLEWEMDHQH
ncbi:pilus assembly protein PilZ [Sporolactobacillus shoreae]|uniref:Pilus assembly protein PilZ n=1 Tax=Sporolactobacillus shoreae TaxID=1465501 RepID=A0A4Z0GQ01_9BACL|nr:flagellar brake domain-containing protein [Sporolactobacillus shoreae]TGA98141.1 pilus assembly protein PilZ [Sporolactobacillus shoreae]